MPRDFLTGFTKRKLDRKAKYDKKLRAIMNEERKAMKARRAAQLSQNAQEIRDQLDFMSSVSSSASKQKSSKKDKNSKKMQQQQVFNDNESKKDDVASENSYVSLTKGNTKVSINISPVTDNVI